MAYQVILGDDVLKSLAKLDGTVRQRIGKVLDRLADNPRQGKPGH
jgi:hypothetical protein